MRKGIWACMIVIALAGAVEAGTINATTAGTVRDLGRDGTPSHVFPNGVVQAINSTYYDPDWDDRGVMEYDISGLTGPVQSAQLNITPVHLIGFTGTPSFELHAYVGDGAVGLGDWSGGSLVGGFTPTAGQTTSIDVTLEVNSLLSSANYIGFRITQTTLYDTIASAVFGYQNQGTAPTLSYTQAAAVPLPASAWIGFGLLGALGAVRRLRRRARAAA